MGRALSTFGNNKMFRKATSRLKDELEHSRDSSV